MKERSNLLGRIYRLKIVALATILILLGVLLAVLGNYLDVRPVNHVVVALVNGLSDVLVVTGGFGIAIDFFTGRDKEAAELERTRSVLKELTPDFTDAVLKGLEVRPDDLKRVATPDLLDTIAINVLGLRLGNAQFAREIYEEVRDQAIRAPERWTDVDVSIRLSGIPERSAAGAPLFDQLVAWEYTTIPSHALRKFACVSDRDEFYDLVSEIPATSVWFMPAATQVDATARTSYELLSFAVDGDELPVKRSARKTGQTYSVRLPAEVVAAGEPVRIRAVYRVVGLRSSHRLFVELPVPAQDVSLTVDYSDTEIARVTVTEAVTSLAKPRVSRLPEHLPGREIKIELPGWVLPRSGITAVWTLSSEESTSGPGTAPEAA